MAFDYSKYSYDELVAEITRLISEKDTWKDTYQSSTGQVLIQMIAAMTDQLNYMLERRTQESFLPTAKIDTSVNAIVGLLGYRPKRQVSASGTLTLSLVDVNGSPVENSDVIRIPKYTKIVFDGKNFTNTEELTLLPTPIAAFPYLFNVKEGLVEELIVDATDTSGTLFNSNYVTIPDYLDIENTSFYITTPSQNFTDVTERIGNAPPLETLGFATSTDQVYDVRTTNSGLRILFGDGINGEKPVGLVSIKYIRTNAQEVEVTTLDNPFVFDQWKTELIDDSATTYLYTLSNSTTILGGAPEESIEQIKANAPAFVRTANRACTKDDYVYWIGESGIGGLVDSSVHGEEEIGITTINANNVYITYLTETGAPLTTSQLSDLDTYLNYYKVITSQLIYNPAEVIPLQINLRLKRNPTLTASNSEVYNFLREEFKTFFEFTDGSLDKEVYHSELVNHFYDATIEKNGVDRLVADYVNIDIQALKHFSTPWISTQPIDVVVTKQSNDFYTILINDIEYTYQAAGIDTDEIVANTLEQYLDLDVSVDADSTTTTGTVTIERNARDVHNDFLYSEDLNTSVWVDSGTITKTQDVVAPDGRANSAWTVADTDGASASSTTQSITGIPQTTDLRNCSVYIGKDTNTTRFPALEFSYTGGSAVSTRVLVNTQTGATTSFGGSPVLNTTEYIDYWRIDISFANDTTNSGLSLALYPAYTADWGTGAVNTALTDSVVVWGFQADDKATVAKYIRTGTKPINMVYQDAPIENRFLYGERLSESVWVKTGCSITNNTEVDTDGFTSLDTVTFTGGGIENVYQDVTNVVAGETYTTSVDLKAGTITSVNCGVYDNTNGAWILDPATKTRTINGTARTFTDSFIIPAGCTSIRLYPAQVDTTAGTIYMGRLQLRNAGSSSEYVPTYNKQIFYFDDYFTIDNTGSTDKDNNSITTPVQIPIPTLFPLGDNLIYPTSVEIINTAGTVLYTDTFVSGSSGTIDTVPSGTIDYSTGVMNIPILPIGEYYVRYKQNVDENYSTNEKQTFSYSLPKESYADTVELLSTIEITN